MNAEQLIDKLMAYYNVFSMHELSSKIGISQPAISKWKINNSIVAIKKKCRELGIYNEIFEVQNTNTNNQTILDNHGNLTQNGKIDNSFSTPNNLAYIDEAALSTFKRAYNKCLNNDQEKSINQNKLDELLIYLTKFK